MDISYESLPSKTQELTFVYSDQRLGIPENSGLCEEPLLRDEEDRYNNLAFMLSDQFESRMVLMSVHGILFSDGGSILQQFDTVLDRLECMSDRMYVKGHTCSMRKFPLAGIRESLLNALIHSDFSNGRSVFLEVSGEALRISSPGGLRMRNGFLVPFPRNEMLAEILSRNGQVNLTASGIRTINESYRNTGLVPRISSGGGEFVVTLPAFTRNCGDFNVRRKKVLDFLYVNRGSDLERIGKGLNMTKGYTRNLMVKLIDSGDVFIMKNGYFPSNVSKNGCWFRDSPFMKHDDGEDRVDEMMSADEPESAFAPVRKTM